MARRRAVAPGERLLPTFKLDRAHSSSTLRYISSEHVAESAPGVLHGSRCASISRVRLHDCRGAAKRRLSRVAWRGERPIQRGVSLTAAILDIWPGRLCQSSKPLSSAVTVRKDRLEIERANTKRSLASKNLRVEMRLVNWVEGETACYYSKFF